MSAEEGALASSLLSRLQLLPTWSLGAEAGQSVSLALATQSRVAKGSVRIRRRSNSTGNADAKSSASSWSSESGVSRRKEDNGGNGAAAPPDEDFEADPEMGYAGGAQRAAQQRQRPVA